MSGTQIPNEAVSTPPHDPMVYELVRKMGPSEFVEAATRLNDRREQPYPEGWREGDPASEKLQQERELLSTLGTIALANVAVREDDQSRDAMVVRLVQSMGEQGLDGLWRAETTIDNIATVRTQLEKQPNGPFLLLKEQCGGLAIEAGRTSGTVDWQMDSRDVALPDPFLVPQVTIPKSSDGVLVCDPWCRIVTDDVVPDRLIWDHIGSYDDTDEVSYQEFLRERLGSGGDAFPSDSTMLALGEGGTAKLVAEFNRLAAHHYAETPLGRLEFKRIQSRINEALGRVDEGEEHVALDPHPNLRADYADILTQELLHLTRNTEFQSESDSHFYDVIERYVKRGRTLDVPQLSRWVTESMLERHGQSIDSSELYAAVKEELEKEIAYQREMLAQRSAN